MLAQLTHNAATNGRYNVVPEPAPGEQVLDMIQAPFGILGIRITGLSTVRQLARTLSCASQ